MSVGTGVAPVTADEASGDAASEAAADGAALAGGSLAGAGLAGAWLAGAVEPDGALDAPDDEQAATSRTEHPAAPSRRSPRWRGHRDRPSVLPARPPAVRLDGPMTRSPGSRAHSCRRSTATSSLVGSGGTAPVEGGSPDPSA